jgi:SH3-like domain-containing protein
LLILVKSLLRKTPFLLALALAAGLLVTGCNRGPKVLEINYVAAPQVALRDQVAAVYNKVGMVKNGDRLEVLDRQRRFVKVRTPAGMEGWMEQRYLISQKTYDQLQKLAQDHRDDPVQATGTTRNDTNIHLEPARDSEHLYQLAAGDKISIIKRATAAKETVVALASNTQAKKGEPKPVMEDWWLVRDSQGRTGWILARMVDIDVPLDIAQYAEGQRIQAFFILNSVQDGDKKVPEYLVLLSEPKDGMPFDFNQIRVFTWNVRKHRYETAYRERNLDGVFPVTLGQESFEKEGTLPTFTVRVSDAQANSAERKYKLNTPIVRRVLQPGEKQEKPATSRHRK